MTMDQGCRLGGKLFQEIDPSVAWDSEARFLDPEWGVGVLLSFRRWYTCRLSLTGIHQHIRRVSNFLTKSILFMVHSKLF